jgi:hypothetical protein
LRTIKEIKENMDELISQIEGVDAIEEVEVEYVAYDKNMNRLLESEDIDTYLSTYDDIIQENSAPLECFNSSSADELKEYIEKNEIDFDRLKTETVSASCEALKFLIYEAEEEEY